MTRKSYKSRIKIMQSAIDEAKRAGGRGDHPTGAQIFSFDEQIVHQIEYRESQPFRLVGSFIRAPEHFANTLFSELSISKT